MSLKALIYTIIFALVIISLVIFQPLFFPKTYITICDIGQGDAFYIHQENGIDMLIDTGPNESVLECLGKAMVFNDKRIDFIFISHPHADHYGGLGYILNHYSVGAVYIPPIATKSSTFTQLLALIQAQSSLKMLTAGTALSLGETSSIITLWPDDTYIQQNTSRHPHLENVRFSTSNPNDFSLVQLYTYNDASVLFTGDVSANILLKLLMQNSIQTVDMLKVPHHGSETGLTDEIFNVFRPDMAIISAAKKNRYNHPAKKIMDMLELHNIPIFLTSQTGTLSFDYKEGNWEIRHSSCFLVFSC